MTIDNEIKKGITKGDIILFVCVILLIAVLFLLSFKGSDKKLTAEIYAQGEKTHSIALSEVGESYTLRINHCELLIEKDGVTFIKLLKEIGYTEQENATASFEMRPYENMGAMQTLEKFVSVWQSAQ